MKHPPLYFGLTSVLEGRREFGGALSAEEIPRVAGDFAEHLLDDSRFRCENKSAWQAWIASNPNDKAAQYMREQIEKREARPVL